MLRNDEEEGVGEPIEGVDDGRYDGEREHAEMIRKMDAYEKACKARLDALVTVYDSDHYDQEFLRKMVPREQDHVPLRDTQINFQACKSNFAWRIYPPKGTNRPDLGYQSRTTNNFTEWCRRHYAA